MKATDRFKYCLNCGKKFYNPYGFSLKQWLKTKFCSRKCFGAFDGKQRVGMDESRHAHWKGDKVGYYGIHDWMTKHYGQPVGCEECGLNDPKRQYHWANLSGNYLRDRNDFKRMCVSCHRKYDYAMRRQAYA